MKISMTASFFPSRYAMLSGRADLSESPDKRFPEPKAEWEVETAGKTAFAVAPNALLVAFGRTMAQRLPGLDPGGYRVAAFDMKTGKPIWEQPLDTEPALWCLAVDREGRVLVTLRDGSVICFGK